MGKEDRPKPFSRAFELGAEDVNLRRKGGGGLMQGLEPGQKSSAHLHPPLVSHEHPLLIPKSRIPGPSPLSGSASYFRRLREAHHFISFQKVTHTFRTDSSLLFLSQVLPSRLQYLVKPGKREAYLQHVSPAISQTFRRAFLQTAESPARASIELNLSLKSSLSRLLR